MQLDQFWRKVDRRGDCWPWTACLVGGYGMTWHEGRKQRAHRVAWLLTRGPIPDGLHVLHSCDNPPCVNPEHLFLGDARDNDADKRAKGRAATCVGERNGNARLNWDLVERLRSEYAAGGVAQRQLAVAYGISPAQVSHIVSGRRWRHSRSVT